MSTYVIARPRKRDGDASRLAAIHYTSTRSGSPDSVRFLAPSAHAPLTWKTRKGAEDFLTRHGLDAAWGPWGACFVTELA